MPKVLNAKYMAPAKVAISNTAKSSAAPKRAKKSGPIFLLSSLILAIFSVVFIPVLVGGAAPEQQATKPMEAVTQTIAPMESLSAAQESLSHIFKTPASLPEEFSYVGCSVDNNEILVLEYQIAGNTVYYRTGLGTKDVSGNQQSYSYSQATQANGTTYTFSGKTQDKLSLAVWADDTCAFAIVAPGGLSAADMNTLILAVK